MAYACTKDNIATTTKKERHFDDSGLGGPRRLAKKGYTLMLLP